MPEQLALFEGATPAFGLVGDSPEIQRVLRIIHKLRDNRSPVLVMGETGTGKELVAQALHAVSAGPRGVLAPINCGALSPTLIESELFGHVRGSFTGATSAREGLLRQASGGTVFLDEIGELPLDMQTKLLRAVEERKVRPLGARNAVPIDVRLIAATNRDLTEEVRQGRFRADLFYRLNVITIHLAPLRTRREDIPVLVRYFLLRYAAPGVKVSDEALRWMLEYDWPGNIRQLRNCIQRMAVLCSRGILELQDLPTQLRNEADVAAQPRVTSLADLERAAIEQAMREAAGNCRKAAEFLGISKTTMYRKLREYGHEHAGRIGAEAHA